MEPNRSSMAQLPRVVPVRLLLSRSNRQRNQLSRRSQEPYVIHSCTRVASDDVEDTRIAQLALYLFFLTTSTSRDRRSFLSSATNSPPVNFQQSRDPLDSSWGSCTVLPDLPLTRWRLLAAAALTRESSCVGHILHAPEADRIASLSPPSPHPASSSRSNMPSQQSRAGPPRSGSKVRSFGGLADEQPRTAW